MAAQLLPLFASMCLLLISLVDITSSHITSPSHVSGPEALHRRWHVYKEGQQCFDFSTEYSIARDDFAYPDEGTGNKKQAKKGAANSVLIRQAAAQLNE